MSTYSEQVDQGLLHSVIEGNLDKVKYYIEKGADVHTTQDQGRRNPLRLASIRSFLHIVKYLVEERGVDPGKDTRVLQMTTMANNNAKEIFRYLLEHGANIDIEDDTLGTTLMIAVREGADEELARWIVDECHANVAFVTKTGEKSTAVHKACQYSALDMIRFLLSRGGTEVLQTPDGRGFTPLIVASSEGRNEVVKLLVEEFKCDINFTTDINPLFIAVQNDLIPTVELLLKLGANPNVVQEKMQCRALHLAASNQYNTLVKLLIEYNAEVDCEDPRGYTPLFMAASEGYINTVRVLLDNGAKLDHRSHQDNTTAVFHAIMSNRVPVVKLLLERGANAYDTKTQDEKTLAEVSREKKNTNMANLLESWPKLAENSNAKLCDVCNIYLEKPKRCSKCKQRVYCSVECQKSDWNTHRLDCGKIN
jgi:ankyrin repeat protein